MKPWFRHKSLPLVVGILSILLLTYLAASVDSLTFEKGTPFSYAGPVSEQAARPAEPPNLDWLVTVMIVVYLALVIAALVFATPRQRRRILLMLLAAGCGLLVLMWWISRPGSGGGTLPTVTPTGVRTPAIIESTPLPAEQPTAAAYEPPKVSPWVSVIVTFVVLLAAALLAWLFLRRRLRKHASLETLADIASRTVDDLQAGRDYGDAILNCYAGMMEAVNKQRGIRRRGNLTPAEFIAVLERARLPAASVRRLTALFERVRYGGKKTSQEEIVDAVACLNEIVAAIREAL